MYYFEDHEPLKEKMKKREQEIFDLIKMYYKQHGCSPSLKELAQKATVSSTSTIFNYLRKLKEKELIDFEAKTPRSIKILEENKPR